MSRSLTAFVSGTITNNPLASGGTTLNSAGLSSLATIASPEIASIILDPAGVNGAPEVVWVTAHSSAATSATIARAKEGTSAREHAAGTPWVHGPTIEDFAPWTPDLIRTINLGTDSSISYSVAAANDAWLVPMEPILRDCVVEEVYVLVATQAGNIDLGIYEYDGSSTFTRIDSTGSVACPAASGNMANIGTLNAQLYRGGRYCWAYASSNTSQLIEGQQHHGSGLTLGVASSFPLPVSISSPAKSSGLPSIFGKVTGGLFA